MERNLGPTQGRFRTVSEKHTRPMVWHTPLLCACAMMVLVSVVLMGDVMLGSDWPRPHARERRPRGVQNPRPSAADHACGPCTP